MKPAGPEPAPAPAPVKKADPVPAPAPRDVEAEIKLLAVDLKAKESAKRIKALERIATHGAKANVVGEELVLAMLDKESAVRDAASEALEKVNSKVHEHVFTIIRGMKKKDAIWELGQLGNEAKITVPLLLHYQKHPELYWNSGSTFEDIFDRGWRNTPDLFSIIAKIAPKDKRFAVGVLESIAAPVVRSRYPGTLTVRRADGGEETLFGYEPRLFGLAQLDVIDAETVDKVKAVVAALGDGQYTIEVITALQTYGKDAASALPQLKKLKLSADDDIRKVATDTIKKIE
jgi:hypothetical protein